MKFNYLKKIFIITLLLLPLSAWAQSPQTGDTMFRAEVLQVLDEQEVEVSEGNTITQQNLLLYGLEGEFKDKQFEFKGIGDLQVVGAQTYEKGNTVMVAASYGADGEPVFYVTDYVRGGSLGWLLVIFVLSIAIVGRLKGLRSLAALAITFFIIIKYIIPGILSGSSPVLVTFVGSFFILLAIIYITEGWNARAHLSVASIFTGLVITIFISDLFVGLARLSGAGSEDVLFLFSLEGVSINLSGLLLSGIIIGALGVLDDVVISQVATVEQIHRSNKYLRRGELFKKAYDVGVSHISSMTNTLFLAYAGASLPLLILFASGTSAFAGWQQAVNTELVATEIVRTLTGSIGLILTVPISTLVAVWWYSDQKT